MLISILKERDHILSMDAEIVHKIQHVFIINSLAN